MYMWLHILKPMIQALYAATSDKTVVSILGKPLYVHYYNAVTVTFMPSLPILVLLRLSTKLAQRYK